MSDKSERATLASIASVAGVSVATVSKVVNGRADVAPTTRALVQDLLQQHDYVARRAEPVGPPTVELLFHGRLTPYSLEVLQGVVDSGAELGVQVVVSRRPVGARGAATAGSPQWVGKLAAAGRLGVIAVATELGNELETLFRARLPIVVVDPINMPRERVVSVGSTNFAGGFTATQHLIELGHERIAYLGGPASAACNQARLHGYRAAMDAAGLRVLNGYVRRGRFRHEDGLTEGAALLALARPPTAIFAGNDESALGAMEAARARGLRVPADLSVVGFDDTETARVASPALTTVAQPLRGMGDVALRTVLKLSKGEKVDAHHVELATELRVRGSAATAPR